MITKRIIPCLDVRDGRVVKGINFDGIQDVADPVEMARFYNERGADELVFYDITASIENRSIFTEVLKKVASQIFIPLTVGGGINTLEDFDRVLKCGADKVSVNSGAIKDPELIHKGAQRYGNQCVVLSMDVKKVGEAYHVFTGAGKQDTGMDALEWAERGVALGAGELVINSIDTDGVKKGFDMDLLLAIAQRVSVPIIASGGAGSMEDFYQLFQHPAMDAGLAASVFHYKEIDIMELKNYLAGKGIPMRRVSPKRELKFDEKGLIPAIVQDYYTKKVLTLAYMNAESLEISMKEGRTCFYSRSRQELWRKGETSGNTQQIVSITLDCDGDALVVEVVKNGPACHTGEDSCFFQPLYISPELAPFSYDGLYQLIRGRKEEPKEGSYTTYLFQKGLDKILKKIGEESAEVIIAGVKGQREEAVYEVADLLYHLMVFMVEEGIPLSEVTDELARRHVVDHKVKQESMK